MEKKKTNADVTHGFNKHIVQKNQWAQGAAAKKRDENNYMIQLKDCISAQKKNTSQILSNNTQRQI